VRHACVTLEDAPGRTPRWDGLRTTDHSTPRETDSWIRWEFSPSRAGNLGCGSRRCVSSTASRSEQSGGARSSGLPNLGRQDGTRLGISRFGQSPAAGDQAASNSGASGIRRIENRPGIPSGSSGCGAIGAHPGFSDRLADSSGLRGEWISRPFFPVENTGRK